MYGEEKFLHDTNLLIQSYKSGKIQHQRCQSCAVGILLNYPKFWSNILGTGPSMDIEEDSDLFRCAGIIKNESEHDGEYLIQHFEQSTSEYKEFNEFIIKKGYTFDQIKEIEFAFESVLTESKDKDCKLGLIKVIKELGKIHWIDEELVQDKINELC